jgi:hypothetical protein
VSTNQKTPAICQKKISIEAPAHPDCPKKGPQTRLADGAT